MKTYIVVSVSKITVVFLCLCLSVGGGHRKADEGVHQSDSEETFQYLSIHQQPRQQLVISHTSQNTNSSLKGAFELRKTRHKYT